MPPAPSYVGVSGLCEACMRDNVCNDRNFCEKNIISGACELVRAKTFIGDSDRT